MEKAKGVVVDCGNTYSSTEFKDPRLGTALLIKQSYYKKYGLDHDHGTPEDESDEQIPIVYHRTETISRPFSMDHLTKARHMKLMDKIRNKSSFNVPSQPPVYKMSNKYIRDLKKCLNNSVKDEVKILKERDFKCAETAMRYYNEKNGTDYEIVETLGSYCCLYIGFWYHCNFRAQSKTDSDAGRQSSPGLFFAELYHKVADEFVVNDCKLLDGLGQCGDTVRGCEMCGDQLWHPVNGFEVGRKGQLELRTSFC